MLASVKQVVTCNRVVKRCGVSHMIDLGLMLLSVYCYITMVVLREEGTTTYQLVIIQCCQMHTITKQLTHFARYGPGFEPQTSKVVAKCLRHSTNTPPPPTPHAVSNLKK